MISDETSTALVQLVYLFFFYQLRRRREADLLRRLREKITELPGGYKRRSQKKQLEDRCD